MPALTVKQVIHAARQLSDAERQKLITELQIAPSRQQVEKAFRRLGPEHRMPGPKQRRMSRLLSKANQEPLSSQESDELDRLIEEYEERTLELVQQVSQAVASSRGNGSKSNAKHDRSR